jgi:TolA-binding protein
MAKKIVISFSVVFCVVLLCLMFFLIAAEYSTDTAALLEEAKAYEAEGNYEQAEAIYRSIVTDYPGTDEAFQAQNNLALLFIVTRDYPAAQAEVDALIADFAEHPELPAAVYDIANHYWRRDKCEQAKQLYKYIPDNRPSSELAFKGRVWVTGCDFRLGNYNAAWEGVGALVEDFSGNQDLAKMIYELANSCWYAAKFEQARGLYKYVADNMPDSDFAVRAQAWVASSDMKLGNYEVAQEEIDALIADFAENPELTGVIYQLADEYWYAGRYEDAKRLYQYVLDREPNGELAIWARAWITGLELMLGNSVSAQEVIDTLIADCNGHPALAQMIYGIANGCWYVEKYEQAQELYKYIADNMPNSNRGMRARAWVAGCDIMLGNYTEAQEGIDALITDFPEHPELPLTVYKLAGVYYDVERYEDGKWLYQHIVDNWPDFEYARWAKFMIEHKVKDLEGLTPYHHPE